MPEMFIILFDCYGHLGGFDTDPLKFRYSEMCSEAQADLIDFLNEHRIEYYVKNLTHNELNAEEQKLIDDNILKYGG